MLQNLTHAISKWIVWRTSGKGDVTSRVRDHFSYSSLVCWTATFWQEAGANRREHMIMFLGRAWEKEIFLGSCGNFTWDEEGNRERERERYKKRIRRRQEVSEIRKHQLPQEQYRICPVTSSNMCVQPLQLV